MQRGGRWYPATGLIGAPGLRGWRPTWRRHGARRNVTVAGTIFDQRNVTALIPLRKRSGICSSLRGPWGEPIPQPAMGHLFRPFFRGIVRPSQEGLGLGSMSSRWRHRGSSTEVLTRFTLACQREPPELFPLQEE